MQRSGIRESFTGTNLAAVLATSSTMSSITIIATRISDLVFADFALLHPGLLSCTHRVLAKQTCLWRVPCVRAR